VVSDVAARGSNGTNIALLVERMHAAACLDNFLKWLRGAHGTEVTLQLMNSGLESWERYCHDTDNSKLALVRHLSRLLSALVEERRVTLLALLAQLIAYTSSNSGAKA
jgi:hypothetical protein